MNKEEEKGEEKEKEKGKGKATQTKQKAKQKKQQQQTTNPPNLLNRRPSFNRQQFSNRDQSLQLLFFVVFVMKGIEEFFGKRVRKNFLYFIFET